MNRRWLSPPASPTVETGAVHIWHLSLAQPRTIRERLWPLLNAEEQARAGRFHFAHDRERFIVAHGLLRQLLAHYTGVPPGDLVFTYNAYGKPRLAFPAGILHFNLSHTAELALCAVSPSPVGVDLEAIRPDFDYDSLLGQVCHAQEITALQALSPAQRRRAFFHLWTCKEAYVKGRGEGLSLPLTKIVIAMQTCQTVYEQPHGQVWTLHCIAAAAGFAAAVAAPGEGWRLRYWSGLP